jgi:hypothetical protein
VALDSASRAKFAELAQSLQVKLDLAGTTAGAKARFE